MHFLVRNVSLAPGIALTILLFSGARSFGQESTGGPSQAHGGPPVYQQHASDGHRREDRRDRRDFRHDSRFVSPQVSAGWFQRPYPYHLDYYKMRYGGSYAPYFGNLYGTPQVVNYPPYYGPYYGGYGGEYANDYGQRGYGEVPMAYPASSGMMMPGTEAEESAPAQMPSGEPPVKASGEGLPAPKL